MRQLEPSRVLVAAARWLGLVVAAAVICLPWAAEQAVEHASFDDRLGTLPVRVGLAHNGHTTLDTGLLGKVYWRHTGPAGFGAELRSTGPPIAGGTLASYVSPAFVRANTQFVDNLDQVAAAYGAELRGQLVRGTLVRAGVAGLLAGSVLTAAWPLVARRSRRARIVAVVSVAVAGGVVSVGYATTELAAWEERHAVGETYPLTGRPEVSFSSPQTREIAEQIQPFIEKNAARIKERSAAYEEAARASVAAELATRARGLQPREGEVVVLAEADPQGSLVGTRVRRDLYAALAGVLPDGSVVLRTIAGDVTSNGTLAEGEFVQGEAAVSPDVPVVAAKGDHDTDVTVDQLLDAGVAVPDTEVVEAGGLRVASGRDPAFKALFGGLVVNESGVTEEELGQALREEVDAAQADLADDVPTGLAVVLHQPRAAEGYLGVDLDDLEEAETSLTTPVEDGIPDLPPGTVTYGHLHDADGPWVIWNTDGDEVTWTVVTQLGTAGGVEENPTFNRFSTPFSVPLKTVGVQLQYVDRATGLQTGLVPITFDTEGLATIGDRVDVGLPVAPPISTATPSDP
ncbi:MAG TPA: hypothetical protein VD864_03135 [Nocardioides sp.]|nr:hypothetical protein [Nocardioides sp.]